MEEAKRTMEKSERYTEDALGEDLVVEEEKQQHGRQEIWSWGAGTEGQLGTGRLEDEHSPQLLHLCFSPSLLSSFCFLSCGGAHVIALTSCGKVLTWGRGSSGQLGHGDLTNCLQPQLIRSLDTLFISHVSAGWNHSGFVSDTGRLFTCGDGSFGQLGHGDYHSYASPVEVSFFGSKHVDQIACGMRHSLVLERGGQVYGFGSGKRGQLGVSKYKIKSSSLPQLSLGLEDVKIGKIYANGDHSAALSADGQLYSWGRGFSGAADASIPHCSCTSTSFTQAALGWNHALALTSEGELFMLGGRHHGSLGDPEKISQVQDISELSRQPNLCKVPGLSGMNVSHIAAGAEHSALVTDRGEVLTWGWGEHGQLGLGNTNDQTHPRLVRLGHAYTNPISSDVYCGSGFTIAQSTLPTFGG